MSLCRSILRAACALLLASTPLGCHRPSEATQESGSTSHALALSASPREPIAPAPSNGYPPGKWRQQPSDELGRTVLWLSDIVIRHREVNFPLVSFHYNGWLTAADLASRTPREALALAVDVVRRARSGARFEDLAREYSDEPETASRGGSLGGLLAGHLTPWPQVLDAVETLEPGEVSDVVETETGYHVLLRRSAPPEALLSGRHLVIAHESAPWIALATRGPVPARTREEAFAIARGLYERARHQPAELERLIAEHSEHRDAVRGGDFGTWSSREPTEFPREVETLARLRVGEVAEPIDSLFGIQIIQRTEDPPRERYAMASVELLYDPSKPEAEPASRQSARKTIEELSVILRTHPERFASLQQKYCCNGVSEVITGRASPALQATLARLSPGQTAAEPIEELNLRFMIVKRLPLAALPRWPEVRYELGAETVPSVIRRE